MACIQPNKFWLDALPSEVHHRIVSYLVPIPGDRDSYYPFLHLAETSKSLRLIVLSALSFKLKITRRLEHIDRWADVFCEHLRELEICVQRKRNYKPVVQLLKAPTLERLTVIARPDLITAIHHAPSLRSVSVTIYKAYHLAGLFNSLRTLPKLTKLKLHIRAPCTNGQNCNLLRAGKDPKELAECCKHVTDLDVSCTCYNTERCIAWRWAFGLPALLDLKLHQLATEWFLDFDFEEADVVNTVILLPRFQRPLVHLGVAFVLRSVVYTAQFAPVSLRPVQESFALSLRTGAKLIFPGSTSELQSLRIEWPSRVWLGEYLYPMEHHGHDRGTLLRSIQDMPALSSLSLMEVRIGILELTSILVHMGSRLEVLGTAIEGQEEEPHERFKTVMEVVSTQNTNLRKLCMDFWLVTKYRGHSDVHSSEILHCKDELRTAYHELAWKCPLVQIYDQNSNCVRSYGDIESVVFGDGCKV